MFIDMALTDRNSQIRDRFNEPTGHTYRAYRLGIANSRTGEDLGIIRVVIDVNSDVVVTAFFEDSRIDRRRW